MSMESFGKEAREKIIRDRGKVRKRYRDRESREERQEAEKCLELLTS